MCGLIAWTGAPSAQMRSLAVRAAAARGPHSHGWAVRDPASPRGWRVTRERGPLRGPAHLVDPGSWTVGHSRLATSSDTPGSTPSPAEGQPLVSLDGWLLAHNGSTDTWDAPQASPADSWGLLALLRDGVQPPRDVTPHAGILVSPDHVLTALRIPGHTRPAHPLYLTADLPTSTVVLSSAPLHPFESWLLPDGYTCIDPRRGLDDLADLTRRTS